MGQEQTGGTKMKITKTYGGRYLHVSLLRPISNLSNGIFEPKNLNLTQLCVITNAFV